MLKENITDEQIRSSNCTDCPENEFYEKYGEDSFPNDNCFKCISTGGPGKGNPANPRKRGKRLPQGTTKKEILEYLLDQMSDVGMSDIREHLKYNWGISDQTTIKKHLDELTADKYISYRYELTRPKDKDRWYIKNMSQLKRIKVKYPEIRLNDKNKAVDVVTKEHASTNGYLTYNKLQRFLRASGTFYNMFLDYPYEEILTKAKILYYFDNRSTFKLVEDRVVSNDYTTVELVISNLLVHCSKIDIIFLNPTGYGDMGRLIHLGKVKFHKSFSPTERIKMPPEELEKILDREERIDYDKEDFDYFSENYTSILALGAMAERIADLD